MSTSSLIFWVSPHHHIFQWLSHLLMKSSFLSWRQGCELAPPFSFSLPHLLCIPCSFWARFPWTSSVYTCSCPSLPPLLWVSFSLCWNRLLVFVHLENYCCSSRFSFSVTFFVKLPLNLIGSIDPPLLWRLKSLSEFLLLCSVISCFCIYLPPRQAPCGKGFLAIYLYTQ